MKYYLITIFCKNVSGGNTMPRYFNFKSRGTIFAFPEMLEDEEHYRDKVITGVFEISKKDYEELDL